MTQVLSDGTTTYLYGIGRIGEYQAAWAYYLPDALGSVRQMASPSGTVKLAQSFDPYGNLLTSEGINVYEYDYANRLTGVTQGADTYAFAYNGLGDRLQQTRHALPLRNWYRHWRFGLWV